MVTPENMEIPAKGERLAEKIVVFNTCSSAEEAERIARLLVERRVAACVNVIAPVRSFYRWRGVVEDATEWLLMIKTSRALFGQVRSVIEGAHSFEVPELIAVPVVEGTPAYLAWMEGELIG
jgi:periplasmic divalent cation tolerance protein